MALRALRPTCRVKGKALTFLNHPPSPLLSLPTSETPSLPGQAPDPVEAKANEPQAGWPCWATRSCTVAWQHGARALGSRSSALSQHPFLQYCSVLLCISGFPFHQNTAKAASGHTTDTSAKADNWISMFSWGSLSSQAWASWDLFLAVQPVCDLGREFLGDTGQVSEAHGQM